MAEKIVTNRFRDDPDAIRGLFRGGEVHRDVYIDEELFELEMERLWRTAWVYVGHDSQVPAAGDYYATEIAGQPLLMIALPGWGAAGALQPMRPSRCEGGERRIRELRRNSPLSLSRLDVSSGRNAAHRAAAGGL